MAHPIRNLIVRLLHCGRSAALTAAVVTSTSAAQSEQLEWHFSVFSLRRIENVTFVSRPNTPPRQVVFHATARSPRYTYHGTMPLRFADAASGEVIAEATIPLEIRQALLLFIPVDRAVDERWRFRIAVLDDGAMRHQAGQLAVVNMSGLQLSGVIGRHAVLLQPGLNPPLIVGTSASIALRAAFKQKTYQSYADQLEIGRNERALLLLFPPYYEGSLEVQSRLLIDHPPKENLSPP